MKQITPFSISHLICASLAVSSINANAEDLSQKNAQAIEDMEVELNKQKDEAVQWHGYFRAGFTSNENGSGSGNSTIQAPNAGAFYRLGGGESNYAATNFSRKFNTDSGAWAKAYFGLVYEDRDARRWVFDTQNKTIFMDKAYVEMGNLDFSPEALFWAGRVNWSDDIHILDRKYYEIRSPGIGVKGIELSNGKLDLFLTSHDSDGDKTYTDENGTTVTYEDDARPRTHTLGVEYRTGHWWLTGSVQTNSENSTYSVTKTIDGVESSYVGETAKAGAHVMVNYTQPTYFGLTDGRVKYVAQYASGTSAAFLGRHGDTNQSNDGGQNYRVFVDGLASFGNWDINTIALFQQKDDVDFEGSDNTWWTIGGRTSYYFNQNLALQLEAGYNGSSYSSDTEEEEGGLATFTIAPTLKLNKAFFSRPEIRFYATYAKYTGDYNAGSLDGYSSNEDDSFTFGAQAEIWF
ncbi:carbohydrate porin [Vibrio sp. dhg]|uniref:carbohydrate porin n=1 Tax=Vibrio sp. dhg TaxID=2163016 RepID=UPI000E4EC429|nr:carbohydrate porin [Vibrio sp. dhg]AXT73732.1 hypothetical protein DBX26_22680 [Vibrio sp. dhg]